MQRPRPPLSSARFSAPIVAGVVASALLARAGRADANDEDAPCPASATSPAGDGKDQDGLDAESPPYQGTRYRYQNMGLFPRIFYDIPAIPATGVDWTGGEWAQFAGVFAPGLILMLPPNPSLDVRIQRWVNEKHSDSVSDIFPNPTDNVMSAGTVAYIAAFWSAGWLSGNRTVLELASLSSEALAVGQLYHVTLKVLFGREGPNDGNGLGIVYGPTARYFPDGTPSGHMITVTTLLSVPGEYWDSWPLRGAAILVSAYMATGLVYNNQHYVSEIIWGGALGYATGIWVVHHRSTRYRYVDGTPDYLTVAPTAVALPGGSQGLGLRGTW